MRMMEDWFDDQFLIAQGPPHRDPGDTAQRMGMYHVGLEIYRRLGWSTFDWHLAQPQEFNIAMGKLIHPNGKIRRTSKQGYWGAEWNRGSRDQSTPMIRAIGILRDRLVAGSYYTKAYIKGHAKRLFLTSNNTIGNWMYADKHHPDILIPDVKMTWWKKALYYVHLWRPKDSEGNKIRIYQPKLADLTLLEFWAGELRMIGKWWCWPFIACFDFHTLLSSLHYRWFRDKEDKDPLNHCVVVCQGQYVMNTPFMWFSKKVTPWDRMLDDMEHYFSRPTKVEGVWHMFLLWQPILVFMKTGEK